MAIVKGKKKSNSDVENPAKKRAKEVVEEEIVEEEVVNEEVESTNPEDYTYLVKLESKKFPGRDAEQVSALIFGALGAMKKITIEKELS